MGRVLLDLPEKTLRLILKFLRFEELTDLRRVCCLLRDIGGDILNTTFLTLGARVDDKINMIKSMLKYASSEDIPGLLLRQKCLQVLCSEVRVLNAVCGRYILSNSCFFVGGSLLDCCEKLLDLNTVKTNQDECQDKNVIICLFLLAEQYLDHFDRVIEPPLLKRRHCSYAWFGTKLIDIVDCYSMSQYHLIVNYSGMAFHLAGRYETYLPNTVDAPPQLIEGKEGVTSEDGKQRLIRYLRNNVRWNNFFQNKACDGTNTCLFSKLGLTSVAVWSNTLLSQTFLPMTGRLRLKSRLDVLRVVSYKMAFHFPSTQMRIVDQGEEIVYNNAPRKERRGSKFTVNQPDGLTTTETCDILGQHGDIYRKVFKRSLGDSPCGKGVYITLDLQCMKETAPLRLEPLAEVNVYTFDPESTTSQREYEFSMEMKVRYSTSQDARLRESLIHLFHNREKCVVSESTRNVELLL